jgi:hypothetical protein
MKDPRAAGSLVVFLLFVAGCYRSAMDVMTPDEPGSGGAGTIAMGGTVGTGLGGAGGTVSTTSDPLWTVGGSGGGYGGSIGYGGVVGDGGIVGYGGTVGYGGIVGYGGDTSNGGQTSVNSGNTVTYSQGMAQGAMTGAGWVALGPLDKITSPTCGGSPITSSTPCTTSTTWSSSNALCASGYIPALPARPAQTDYDNNWGIDLCANATTPPTGTLATTFRTIAVYLSGSPTTGLRVMVHRIQDADDVWYCAYFSSGSAVALTSLNTACWDGTGFNLTSADVQLIDRVGIQIPSSNVAITLNNLCITKIVFAN